MKTFKTIASAVTAACALWSMLMLGPGSALAASDSCPNAEVRALQSATYLPDCRAYELVSPADKEGNNVAADQSMTESAIGGNAIKWTSAKVFGDAVAEMRGAEYVSQRGTEGWWTHGVNPEQPGPLTLQESPMYTFFSEDLTKGVYWALSPVLSGHPNVEKVANLYLRTDVLSAPPGTYELLSDSVTPLGERLYSHIGREVEFGGASADWSRILIESVHNLTASSAGANPSLPKLYEWHNGVLTLAGILPDGSPAEGSLAGSGAGVGIGPPIDVNGLPQGSISSDGSRIVFTAPPFDKAGSDQRLCGSLYMRINGSETVPVNADERSEPDPNGPKGGCFWTATPDESEVFFTSGQALTEDATPGNTIVHYYRYNLNAPPGKHLTLLAQVTQNGYIHPGIIGISTDGSYVYFTSSPIHEGDPETGGIYVWHEGKIRFIAGHKEAYLTNDLGLVGRSKAVSFRVTPNGKTISFLDQDPVDLARVGYKNNSQSEIMLYNYDANKLVCVSCDLDGAPPAGEAGNNAEKFGIGDSADAFPAEEGHNMYENRTLTSDGRYVFFDTPDPLVPEDTNGQRDVYEYDTRLGRALLLSGGECNCNSEFVDATPDGRNAFIVTHQSLVHADFDTAGDLYDVRADGGFVAQSRPLSGPCEGDDCQGPAKAAPSFSVPASATFAGRGNPPGATAAPSGRRRSLTRVQKLARALRACHAKRRKRRVNCEARARKRYGAHGKSGKRASRRAGR